MRVDMSLILLFAMVSGVAASATTSNAAPTASGLPCSDQASACAAHGQGDCFADGRNEFLVPQNKTQKQCKTLFEKTTGGVSCAKVFQPTTDNPGRPCAEFLPNKFIDPQRCGPGMYGAGLPSTDIDACQCNGYTGASGRQFSFCDAPFDEPDAAPRCFVDEPRTWGAPWGKCTRSNGKTRYTDTVFPVKLGVNKQRGDVPPLWSCSPQLGQSDMLADQTPRTRWGRKFAPDRCHGSGDCSQKTTEQTCTAMAECAWRGKPALDKYTVATNPASQFDTKYLTTSCQTCPDGTVTAAFDTRQASDCIGCNSGTYAGCPANRVKFQLTITDLYGVEVSPEVQKVDLSWKSVTVVLGDAQPASVGKSNIDPAQHSRTVTKDPKTGSYPTIDFGCVPKSAFVENIYIDLPYYGDGPQAQCSPEHSGRFHFMPGNPAQHPIPVLWFAEMPQTQYQRAKPILLDPSMRFDRLQSKAEAARFQPRDAEAESRSCRSSTVSNYFTQWQTASVFGWGKGTALGVVPQTEGRQIGWGSGIYTTTAQCNCRAGCASCPDATSIKTSDVRNRRHLIVGFRGSVGFTKCEKCTPGRFQDEMQKGSCKACPAGQYQDGHGADACKTCPAGRFAEKTGLSHCALCNTWCPAGKHKNDCGAPGNPSSPGTPCKACAAGTFKIQGTHQCVACPAGTYGLESAGVERNGVYCRGCAKGKYQYNTGTVSCIACPSGKTSEYGAAECHEPGQGPLELGPTKIYSPKDAAGSEALLVAWNVMTRFNRLRRSCGQNTMEPMRTFEVWNITKAKSDTVSAGSLAGFCGTSFEYRVKLQFSVYSPFYVTVKKDHGKYSNITFHRRNYGAAEGMSCSTCENERYMKSGTDISPECQACEEVLGSFLNGELSNGKEAPPLPYICDMDQADNDMVWDPKTFLYRQMHSSFLRCKRAHACDTKEETSALGANGFSFAGDDNDGEYGFADEAGGLGGGSAMASMDEDSSHGFGAGGETAQACIGNTAGLGSSAGKALDVEQADTSLGNNYYYGEDGDFGGTAAFGSVEPGSSATGSTFETAGGLALGGGAPPGPKRHADCKQSLQAKLRLFVSQNATIGGEDNHGTQAMPGFTGMNTTINGTKICQQLASGDPLPTNASISVFGKPIKGIDKTREVAYGITQGTLGQMQKDSAGTETVASRRLADEMSSDYGFNARRRLAQTEGTKSMSDKYVTNLLNLTDDEYQRFSDTTKRCFDIAKPSSKGSAVEKTYLVRRSPKELEALRNQGVSFDVQSRTAIVRAVSVSGAEQDVGVFNLFHECLEKCIEMGSQCEVFTHYVNTTTMGRRKGHCYVSNDASLKHITVTESLAGATSGTKKQLSMSDYNVVRAKLVHKMYRDAQEAFVTRVGLNDPNSTMNSGQKAVGQKWLNPATPLEREFDPRKKYPKCYTFFHIGAQRANCNTCWAWTSAQLLASRMCVQSDSKYNDVISPEGYANCMSTHCGKTDYPYVPLAVADFRATQSEANTKLADYMTLVRTNKLMPTINTDPVSFQCVNKNWDPDTNPNREGTGPKSEFWEHIHDELNVPYPGCHQGTKWFNKLRDEPMCRRRYPALKESVQMLRHPFRYQLRQNSKYTGNEMEKFTRKLSDKVPLNVVEIKYFERLSASAITMASATETYDYWVWRTAECQDPNSNIHGHCKDKPGPGAAAGTSCNEFSDCKWSTAGTKCIARKCDPLFVRTFTSRAKSDLKVSVNNAFMAKADLTESCRCSNPSNCDTRCSSQYTKDTCNFLKVGSTDQNACIWIGGEEAVTEGIAGTEYETAVKPLVWIRDCQEGRYISPTFEGAEAKVGGQSEARKILEGELRNARFAEAKGQGDGPIAVAENAASICGPASCTGPAACSGHSDATACNAHLPVGTCTWGVDFNAAKTDTDCRAYSRSPSACIDPKVLKGENGDVVCAYGSPMKKLGANSILDQLEKRSPRFDARGNAVYHCRNKATPSCNVHANEVTCNKDSKCWWQNMECAARDLTCTSSVTGPTNCDFGKGQVMVLSSNETAVKAALQACTKCSDWQADMSEMLGQSFPVLKVDTSAAMLNLSPCSKHLEVYDCHLDNVRCKWKWSWDGSGKCKPFNRALNEYTFPVSVLTWDDVDADVYPDQCKTRGKWADHSDFDHYTNCSWVANGNKHRNQCRPSSEHCTATCGLKTDEGSCSAAASDCEWVPTQAPPVFHRDDWRVMDWRMMTFQERGEYCRSFFMDHARKVTGEKDVSGTLNLFGLVLQWQQVNLKWSMSDKACQDEIGSHECMLADREEDVILKMAKSDGEHKLLDQSQQANYLSWSKENSIPITGCLAEDYLNATARATCSMLSTNVQCLASSGDYFCASKSGKYVPNRCVAKDINADVWGDVAATCALKASSEDCGEEAQCVWVFEEDFMCASKGQSDCNQASRCQWKKSDTKCNWVNDPVANRCVAKGNTNVETCKAKSSEDDCDAVGGCQWVNKMIAMRIANKRQLMSDQKAFMEIMFAANEEYLMREIRRGGIGAGLRSAATVFGGSKGGVLDCDCFLHWDDEVHAPAFACQKCPFDHSYCSALDTMADHAIVLIGWGEDDEGVPYWLGKNSWGTAWGEDGYFRVRRGVNSCLLDLSHSVIQDPDIAKLEKQTEELNQELQRNHTHPSLCSQSAHIGKWYCTDSADASYSKWECQNGGYFDPARIVSKTVCHATSDTASDAQKQKCAMMKTQDVCEVPTSGCSWSVPGDKFPNPCQCLYPYVNDPAKPKQGCTKCAPRCANGGQPFVGSGTNDGKCGCVCPKGYGGKNCEDQVRVECAADEVPLLHYHFSFDTTPGDYFSIVPEGKFSLACEQRFSLCDIKSCVCGGKYSGAKCDIPHMRCICKERDGAIPITQLSSTGRVTVQFKKWYPGYTHTMADSWKVHRGGHPAMGGILHKNSTTTYVEDSCTAPGSDKKTLCNSFQATATGCKKPNIENCVAGKYRLPGGAHCAKCPAGRYTDTENLNQCKLCAQNTHTSEKGGATSCQQCSAGQFTLKQVERADAPQETCECEITGALTKGSPANKCLGFIAHVAGIFQFTDKGKNGPSCGMYWAKATALAVNSGACSPKGSFSWAYDKLSSKWGGGGSDSDSSQYAWKSPIMRCCWSTVKAVYDSTFASTTQWGDLCDISASSPKGCPLPNKCLNSIALYNYQNQRFMPDYVAENTTDSTNSSQFEAWLTDYVATPASKTCPDFYSKALTDLSAQTVQKWHVNETTGEWSYVKDDVCPVAPAPVWRSDLYRRCWNAIRYHPAEYKGFYIQPHVCDPTNGCYTKQFDPWIDAEPLTGGSCLDVDMNGKVDAFDVMAIHAHLSVGRDFGGEVLVEEMLKRRRDIKSVSAATAAEISANVDICNPHSTVAYRVSSGMHSGSFTADDSRLLMVYAMTPPGHMRTALLQSACGATCTTTNTATQVEARIHTLEQQSLSQIYEVSP